MYLAAVAQQGGEEVSPSDTVPSLGFSLQFDDPQPTTESLHCVQQIIRVLCYICATESKVRPADPTLCFEVTQACSSVTISGPPLLALEEVRGSALVLLALDCQTFMEV